jgi:hypothetical protein
MNTLNNNLLKAISAKETKELTTIVKETIAVGFNQQKHFTAADLWNIQRRKRSIGSRNRFA